MTTKQTEMSAKPETQGEREELVDAITTLAIAQSVKGNKTSESVLIRAAALLSAGPARVEPLTEALLYCRDDYNYLIGITENKDNLHGWLRMRLANVDLVLNKKGGV